MGKRSRRKRQRHKDRNSNAAPSVESETKATRSQLPVHVWRLMPHLALLVLAAWIAALGFRPITNNDFWFHLRVGKDVLAQGAVPHVDRYSGAAYGSPFIANAWLADVAFAWIEKESGELGFALLRMMATLASAALLFFSLSKRQRSSPVVLPILALCVFLTCWRIAMRPILFTLVILCLASFLIERWRRSGRVRDLLWFVPLHAAWANLHGSYLFGVGILGVIAGSLAILSVFPRLQPKNQHPRYGWRDTFGVAGIALACLLASLANPYGTEVVELSLRASTGNELIRQRMSEWHGPFAQGSYFRAHFQYLFWAYCAALGVLWSALLVRARTLPVLDVAIALVVTLFSIQANRFVPYLAIFGFPIMVRSWNQLLEGRSSWRRYPLFELAIAGFLLATTVTYGYAYGTDRFGKLGWGYGGTMPYAEVAFIKQQRFAGVLYNEQLRDGSFIIHELSPRVRPVIDARLAGGDLLYEEHALTHSSRRRLREYLRKYDVNLVLAIRGGWIGGLLRRDPGWELVFKTADRLVLVRRR